MSTGIGVGVSSVFGGVKASPSFEYSASAFCADAYPDPVPTINGTPGGTFSAAPVAPSTGTLVIDSSTGRVTLASSDPGNYLVTYTIGGVSESDPFEVLAVQTTGFSYSSNSFSDSGTAIPTITGSAGGVFTATTGLSIDANTGVIDLGASTVGGPYTVTYTNTGACQGTPSTFDISITATVRIIANNFAMEFDGPSSQYVNAPISALNSATVCSISFWGKKDSSSVNLNVGGYITGSQGIWITWYLDGNIYFSPRGTGGGSFGLTYAQTYDNNWHHYIGVYDGTSAANCKLYLDGNLVATGTGTPPSSLPATTGDVFQVGALGTTFYTTGSIDEVAVWNKAISANAVQEIYNATINNPGYTADLFKLANESQAPVFWNRMGDD